MSRPLANNENKERIGAQLPQGGPKRERKAILAVDATDRRLLNLIQEGFPLAARPYAQVGEMLGITGAEVRKRISCLKERGIIRRIGVVFDPRKLGFSSILCAARVPAEKLRDFVEKVNAHSEVTHNYRRNHDYNVWFTLIAPGKERLAAALAALKAETGITDILTLRAVTTFKINAKFEV